MHILLPKQTILKTLGQFENLAFVMMSTRENIRLIARAQCMLLLMRIAIIGLRLFFASLKILGPSPSNPVAFDESKAFTYDCTCSDVTNGIFK